MTNSTAVAYKKRLTFVQVCIISPLKLAPERIEYVVVWYLITLANSVVIVRYPDIETELNELSN